MHIGFLACPGSLSNMELDLNNYCMNSKKVEVGIPTDNTAIAASNVHRAL